jgi:hypothetical protein
VGRRASRRRSAVLVAVSIFALALVLNAAAAPVRSGALDRSFGDGRVLAEPNDTFLASSFEAMVRQPDGKLVLELSRETPSGTGATTIERRGEAGHLDKGFGSGGAVEVPPAQGLAVAPGGGILFAADLDRGCSSAAVVHLLTPGGTADTAFGTGGAGAEVPLAVAQIAVAPDGSILLAGSALHGPCGHDLEPRRELALARLLPDGASTRASATAAA